MHVKLIWETGLEEGFRPQAAMIALCWGTWKLERCVHMPSADTLTTFSFGFGAIKSVEKRARWELCVLFFWFRIRYRMIYCRKHWGITLFETIATMNLQPSRNGWRERIEAMTATLGCESTWQLMVTWCRSTKKTSPRKSPKPELPEKNLAVWYQNIPNMIRMIGS